MTAYEALLKVPLGATPADKLRVLRDGLPVLAVQLVDEGVPANDLAVVLEEAIDAAHDAASMRDA